MLDKEGYRHTIDFARGLVTEPPGHPGWEQCYAIDVDVLLSHIESLEQIIDGFLVEWQPTRPSLQTGGVNRADLPRILALRAGVDSANRLARWEVVVRREHDAATIAQAAARQKELARRPGERR